MEIKTIDAKELIEDARKSCGRESYRILHKDSAIRVGTGARLVEGEVPHLFIDVSIKFCPGNTWLSTSYPERAMALIRELESINYKVDCSEGHLNCEKSVRPENLNKELEAVRHLLTKHELDS